MIQDHKKINILIFFGGNSPEHDVSINSIVSLVNHLDYNIFNIFTLYFTSKGNPSFGLTGFEKFKQYINTSEIFKGQILENSLGRIENTMCGLMDTMKKHKKVNIDFFSVLDSSFIDIVFPVFHGENGEDGTIQGLLDFLRIPYIGSNIFCSAATIDKTRTKEICKANNIDILDYKKITTWEYEKRKWKFIEQVEANISYPVIVKPANTGSSFGISKALNRTDLINSILKAFQFSEKLLVEPALDRPRELSIGILGYQNDCHLSEIGEFNYNSYEYFDYNAKYIDSQTGDVPAVLSDSQKKQIINITEKIFNCFQIHGLGRIDFFLHEEKIILNEINSIPSLDYNGTFIRSWLAKGYDLTSLIKKAVDLALRRYKSKNSMKINSF